jgi:hypothetical protein
MERWSDGVMGCWWARLPNNRGFNAESWALNMSVFG